MWVDYQRGREVIGFRIFYYVDEDKHVILPFSLFLKSEDPNYLNLPGQLLQLSLKLGQLRSASPADWSPLNC